MSEGGGRDGEETAPAEAASSTTDATIADLRTKYPELVRRLEAAGYKQAQLELRLLQCANTGLSEEIIIRALFDDGPRANDSKALVPSGNRSPARRQLQIIKHSIVRWYRRHGLVRRIFYLSGWGAALLGPTIHAGLTWFGGIGIGAVVLMRLYAAAKDFDPKHIPILEENHEARQIMLEGLIHTQQQWMSSPPNPRETLQYQIRVLQLITSYVRDHRSDLKQRKIFTNLLVRRGSAVIVCARSDFRRKFPEAYTPEQCTIAWRCLQTGLPQFTGDVYEDSPTTPAGKRYSSILVLPIKIEHRILGVISVDSEEKSHFDNVFEALQSELAPYVQLLAITLLQDHDVPDRSKQRALSEGNDNGGTSDDS